MAGTQYFTGQKGFTGLNKSGAFGNTPGSSALWSFNDNGSTKYFLPETYAAGNNWSGAQANTDYLKSIGGREYTTPTYMENMNEGNPFAYTGQGQKQQGGARGYVFDSLPDFAGIEQNSSFLPGQGSNGSIWGDGMLGDVALKMGTAMGLGAGLSSMAGAGTIGSGGGTITAAGQAPGGALMAGGAGSTAPALGVMDAGAGALAGAGSSTVPAFGGMAGSAAPSIYGSVPASSSFLDSLSGGLGSIGDKISNMSGRDWLGVGDLGARLWQMNQMNNIAEEAANKGDALSQPQRIPYQKLLSDYLTGNQDITEQPYVKSNMDFAMKQARANMAKKGTTGAGGAERELLDYANNAYNSTALPYLQQLSGMAGFGFGPGYSGNLYGQYASQASAAPSMILNDIGRLYGYNQNNQTPWQSKANNAQIQLSGLGPGMNTPVY